MSASKVSVTNSLASLHPDIAAEWHLTKNRTGRGNGCPYCAGQKVSNTNSLASLHPGIAAQWHSAKNGALTPNQG